MPQLGKIKKIDDLRNIWKHEAIDFTNWLAQEENLSELGEDLGLDISLIQTEADVGGFSVDILAEESQSADKIIIENQLERTNHDHLGKIITYASGYDAKYIIWIAKDVREEHIQAVNWLNEHTSDHINFFLLKIELWQIGDSAIAPKFQIICRPNEWGKSVRSSVKETEATKSQNVSYNLWSEFKEYALQHNIKYSLQTPQRQHWYSITMGSSIAHIELKTATRNNEIFCQLYIRDNHDLFKFLDTHRSEIEEKIGDSLDWNFVEGRKASYIQISNKFDFEGDKNVYLSWMLNSVNKFYQVFKPYLKKYK